MFLLCRALGTVGSRTGHESRHSPQFSLNPWGCTERSLLALDNLFEWRFQSGSAAVVTLYKSKLAALGKSQSQRNKIRENLVLPSSVILVTGPCRAWWKLALVSVVLLVSHGQGGTGPASYSWFFSQFLTI